MIATKMKTEFAGRRGRLFWLTLKTSLLTLLTLGFYRFWMKTRLRRWYWSAVRPGGQPLEYVGEPIEKLLGFLIAVVILAFYIGVINLLLMFASFSLLNDNLAAYAMSFIGIIPIFFFARYRARRYVLARTRWRGVRFGLDQAAWAYSLRAVGHWLLTILTLGLLYPRQVFYLEKFRTDRTWYGTAQLHQGGNWKMLYPGMWNMLLPGYVSAIVIGSVWMEWSEPNMLRLLFITFPWFVLGLLFFKVRSFRLLTSHKTADGVGLKAEPRSKRVLGIYLLGYGISYFLLTLLILAFIALAVAVWMIYFRGNPDDVGMMLGQFPRWGQTAAIMVLYFTVFILWGVLQHVFVTMPLYRHYAQTLTITNPVALTGIRQRERDESREAGGFAEALDLGAAI